MKSTLLLLLFSFFIQPTFAQYQIGIIPRVSPDKMIYQKIGNTEVEVKYGSPSVKDRIVWGELVPYSKVWRAGANSATTIEFNSDVLVGGKELDSGKYSFFVIPESDKEWTVVFNKTSKQWGAFKYEEAEDAIRIKINPTKTSDKTEELTYSISQDGFKKGSIILNWDYIKLEVHFETNYLIQFKELIETRAEAQPDYIKWIPYLQGAEHLEELHENIELAKMWIAKSEKIMDSTSEWNEQFYPREYIQGHLYWTFAKISAWDEDYKTAIEYTKKLKGLKKSTFYEDHNEYDGIDEKFKLWKSK